jgi:hypothetical protein
MQMERLFQHRVGYATIHNNGDDITPARYTRVHMLQLQLAFELAVDQCKVVLSNLLPCGGLKVDVRATLKLLGLRHWLCSWSACQPFAQLLVVAPFSIIPVSTTRTTTTNKQP